MQEPGTGKSVERPIRLGGMLVTLVEPHRGHEVAYNRWYERDHFYAGCMVGAWTLSGARYVATADCKARRDPALTTITGTDAGAGSYLALYFIVAGKFGEWIQWGTEQVKWLHAEDRMFPHRDHVHTLMYKFRAERETPNGVPTELALDRRFPGLVMTIVETPAGTDPDAVANVAQHAAPADLLVVGTPVPLLADAPSDVPRDTAADRVLLLSFLDRDPVAAWDASFGELAAALDRSGLATTVFSSAFRVTVPGTDTYTDQLWA